MIAEEFSNLFEEDLCILELKAGNKEEVLQEFVDLLYEAKRIIDKEIVLDMLMRRESLGSTAVGKGVAIPHGRTLMIRKLIIAFGRCRQGLNFDAPDGKPVHLFFLIIAPYQEGQNRYLPTLGKIVEFFLTKRFREKLLQVSSFEELQDVLSAETGSG